MTRGRETASMSSAGGLFGRIPVVAMVAAAVLTIGWVWLQPRARPDAAFAEDGAAIGKTPPFGAGTFIHFYLGARAALKGGDAYHPEESLGPSGYAYRPLFHPPPSLLPYLPTSQMSFRWATWINVVVNTGLLSISGWLWGSALSGASRDLKTRVACACSWVLWLPCLNLLGTGQCSAWALFGISLWLACLARGRSGMAGASLVAVVVKPHLAAVAVAFALGCGFGMRRSRMAWAFVLSTLTWCALTHIFIAGAWMDFWEFVRSSRPGSMRSATLAALVGRALGDGHVVLLHVVWLCAGLWALIAGWRISRPPVTCADRDALGPDFMRGLVIACTMSLALVPHAYSYDFIFLLPAFWAAMAALVLQRGSRELISVLAWLALSVVWIAVKTKSVGGETDLWWIPWMGLLLFGQSPPSLSRPHSHPRLLV